jgi:hypothetical protein
MKAEQDTIAWQTYQEADGSVIYGGEPLGPAPTSTPIACTSPTNGRSGRPGKKGSRC